MPVSAQEYNPFAPYEVRLYCPDLDQLLSHKHCHHDFFVAPIVPDPGIVLRRTGRRIEARIRSERLGEDIEYALYHEHDMELWRGSIERSHVVNHFQGRIGERALSLVLSSFIDELVENAQQDGYSATEGSVLKEKRKKEGRPYRRHVVASDDTYILQFDRRTTFNLLIRSEQGRRSQYLRKRGFDPLVEIDGLAELYVSRATDEGGKSYLLIAEVNTTRGNEIWPSSWALRGRKRPAPLEERLFTPLRELLPEYQLVYVLMGNRRALFHNSGPYSRLTGNGTRIVKRLRKVGIPAVFMPLPSTIDCHVFAEEFYEQLCTFRSRTQF